MQSEWGLIAKARPVNNQRLKAVSLGREDQGSQRGKQTAERKRRCEFHIMALCLVAGIGGQSIEFVQQRS